MAKDLVGGMVLGDKNGFLNHDLMALARNFYRLDSVVSPNKGTPINPNINPNTLFPRVVPQQRLSVKKALPAEPGFLNLAETLPQCSPRTSPRIIAQRCHQNSGPLLKIRPIACHVDFGIELLPRKKID